MTMCYYDDDDENDDDERQKATAQIILICTILWIVRRRDHKPCTQPSTMANCFVSALLKSWERAMRGDSRNDSFEPNMVYL